MPPGLRLDPVAAHVHDPEIAWARAALLAHHCIGQVQPRAFPRDRLVEREARHHGVARDLGDCGAG